MDQATESPLVFTDAAAQKVGQLIADEGNPALMLRVFVQGGGCSGLSYGMALDEGQPEEGDNIFEQDATDIL